MKSVENEFKCAEKRFLRMILGFLETKLTLKDIEIKFSRRNYDNLQTKSQVLTTLLSNPKVHPELAFVHSGLFLDPESAYLQSKTWWEENERKAMEQVQMVTPIEGTEEVDDE
jgi:hypothetical protein